MLLGDAQAACLFQCGDGDLFAVLPDKAGTNIPRSSCTSGGVMLQEFKLGRYDPVPAAISPEPIPSQHHRQGPLHLARGAALLPKGTARPTQNCAASVRNPSTAKCSVLLELPIQNRHHRDIGTFRT